MNFRLNLIIALLLSQYTLFSQDKKIDFFKVIKGDSVMLFFNQNYFFSEKKCSEYTRYIRMDSVGDFNGYFEDLNQGNRLLGKGKYTHGKKQGSFEIYYLNGKIKCKGEYLDNNPIGQWDFFYENGLPERTLRITETDTLLINFYDDNNNLKIINGEGIFNGYVYYPSQKIIAKGKIVNGKPDGKWTSTYQNNIIFCKEEFKLGKFIHGIFPNAILDKDYNNKSFLNTFFQQNYLTSLENFMTSRCPDSLHINNYKNFSFDMANFSSELRPKIAEVIENDIINGNTQDYSIGDFYVTVQFSTNKDGKAENFGLISGGQQFFNSITTTIKMHARFLPLQDAMFFHLKLNFGEGFYYQYTIKFSKNSTFN